MNCKANAGDGDDRSTGLENIAQLLRDIGHSPGLRKARVQGNNIVAGCRHNLDSTPSLNIYWVEGSNGGRSLLYKCYSCDEAGSLVGLIHKDTGMTKPEVRRLIDKCIEGAPVRGVATTTPAPVSADTRALDAAAGFCHFVAWDDGAPHSRLLKRSREYLEKRASLRQIRQLQLGVVPTKVVIDRDLDRYLTRYGAMSLRGEVVAVLAQLRGSVTLPTVDESGHTASLCTRTSGSSPSGDRYSNVGPKGESLFGLGQAAGAISREKHAIIVEGPFDVASVRELGARCVPAVLQRGKDGDGPLANVVACLGAFPSAAQLKTLKRHTDRIVMVRDGDKADDIDGAIKIVQAAIAEGLEATVVAVPDGLDPDEYVTRLFDGGLTPENALQDFSENVLSPARDLVRSFIIRLVEMHPCRDMEFWRSFRSLAQAYPSHDEAVIAAALAYHVDAPVLRAEFKAACSKLDHQALYDAFREDERHPRFRVGRQELRGVIARCNSGEVLVWLVLQAEAAKLKSVDGSFRVAGWGIGRNAGLEWRQTRTVMGSLKAEGLVSYDILSERREFQVKVSLHGGHDYILVPFDFVWKKYAAGLGSKLPALLALKCAVRPGKPTTTMLPEAVAELVKGTKRQVGAHIADLVRNGHVREYASPWGTIRLVSLLPVESAISG